MQKITDEKRKWHSCKRRDQLQPVNLHMTEKTVERITLFGFGFSKLPH